MSAAQLAVRRSDTQGTLKPFNSSEVEAIANEFITLIYLNRFEDVAVTCSLSALSGGNKRKFSLAIALLGNPLAYSLTILALGWTRMH